MRIAVNQNYANGIIAPRTIVKGISFQRDVPRLRGSARAIPYNITITHMYERRARYKMKNKGTYNREFVGSSRFPRCRGRKEHEDGRVI